MDSLFARERRRLGRLLLAFGLASCGPSPAPVVVLVSWDTTRADALGCYADVAHWGLDLPSSRRPTPHTPQLDALAASGVRHQWAIAHAPTTLASHTSLMSGRDTRGARVPRNGFPVEPDVPLLAPRFTAAGWQSLAVVGASVLSRDMGLSRGFLAYDDRITQKVRRRYERSAADVVDRTLAMLDRRGLADRWTPLFLFVHFFDAHSPWDTGPAELRAALVDPDYAGTVDGSSDSVDWLVKATRQGRVGSSDRIQARALYLAEVAAMDAALGTLLDGLRERFTMEDSLVVVVGDHGEALDLPANRPYGHGFDVDLVASHVPFVASGTGRFEVPAGVVVERPVGLMDVAPTIAAMVGLDADPSAQGLDLQPAWRGDPDFSARLDERVLLTEATKPTQAEEAPHWNNLRKERAAVGQGLILTEAPWEEPVGPTVDVLAPGQPSASDPAGPKVERLEQALEAWDGEAPAYRDPAMTSETKAALKALGYLD